MVLVKFQHARRRDETMLSDLVAERLFAVRDGRRLSRKQLAAECARLGRPTLTEQVLYNIEAPRKGVPRREVTVDEWLVLAAALRLPPMDLLLPLGTAAAVEVIGGVEAATDRVLEWVTLGFPPDGLPEVPTEARRALVRVSRHAALVSAVLDAISQGPAGLDDDFVPDWQRELDATIEQLTLLRRHMRSDGQVPPTLPPELQRYEPEVVTEDAAAAERALRRARAEAPTDG